MRRCSPIVPFLLALCAGSSIAHASSGKYVTSENDRYYDTDRYYTNGIQLTLSDAGGDRPGWARRACALFRCADAPLQSNAHHLGQLMYTPMNIQESHPQPFDRPWAGLLYYERSYTFEAPDQMSLTTLAWLVGVTGSASLAEQSQRVVHKLMDIPPPQGWDNQVGGSLGLMGTAEKRWALRALGADFGNGMQVRTAAYGRVALGNVMTHAAAGIAIALGKDLPSVVGSPTGIQNKARRAAPLDVVCLFKWLRCTTFASAELRAVAYNVFLDGRLGRDDPEVDSRPLVGETAVGMRIDLPRTRTSSHGPWFVQVKVTRRSKEFRSERPVFSHTFGAITAGVDW
ncbi:MAG TPA: lipid A deacylase LpxR family protein [Telluria sp.]